MVNYYKVYTKFKKQRISKVKIVKNPLLVLHYRAATPSQFISLQLFNELRDTFGVHDI